MSPRKVDPYVYVMEWICRHGKAKRVAQLVLLHIGRAMQWTPAGFETPPLPTETIVHDTGLVDSTVRKQIEILGALDGDLEIIRGRRRGETYRYRLRREQVLPLDDLQPSHHRRMAAVSPPFPGGEHSPPAPPSAGGGSADSRRWDRRAAAVSAPTPGGGVSAPDLSLEAVRTEVLVPSTTEEEEAAVFFEWFCRTYFAKRCCPYRVKRDVALDVITDLLRDRSLQVLQVMALWMFAAQRDRFIVESDYSLFVLQHKATYLHNIVLANGGLGPDGTLPGETPALPAAAAGGGG